MTETIQVLITQRFSDDLMNELKGLSPRLEITTRPVENPDEIEPEVWEKTEVLYTSDLLPEPEWVPNLRWVQFHWAGVDALLDDPLLQNEDLLATTLSGANASQVAEYVMMMLLALGHHMPDLTAHKAQALWAEDRWERFQPRELRDSTVGIVGYGSVGRQVARLLHTFGATVLATKHDAMHPEDTGYHSQELGDPGGDLVHRLYPPQAIKSMFKECDFIVVSVPLTGETRHLIGAAELAACKPSAYLIDISRGNVIDHEALVSALEGKQLAGAGLDVFPEEPLPPENPLWHLPNVLLSPHIAGNTPHYDHRAIALFSDNLYRYLAGMPLFNQVDLAKGY